MPGVLRSLPFVALAFALVSCQGRFQPRDAGVDGDVSPDGDAEDAGDRDADDAEAGVDGDLEEDLDADGDEEVERAVTFADRAGDGFAAGTFHGTAESSTGLVLLDTPGEGFFLSRVFDAGRDADWRSIRWEPRAPYEKPLPDGGAAETGYGGTGVDMDASVLLLHLDPSRPFAHGDAVADSSGRGNDARAHAPDAPLGAVTGRIDLAIADRMDTYLRVPLATTDDFEFGTDDLTWSLWVATTGDCDERNRVFLGIDGLGAERTHLWLGCTRAAGTSCPDGEAGGRAGGHFRSVHSAADGGGFCGRTVINDGRWHHIALVKSGHSSATLALWVDGALEAEIRVAFAAPFGFPGDPDLTLGDFTGGTYPAEGHFDEVAIWRRALSAAEVRGVFLRGALRLRLQVRACAAPDCSDGPPFVGPDGTAATSFVDRRAPSAPVCEASLPPLSGRYFQYRALLESDAPGERPALGSITIEGSLRP